MIMIFYNINYIFSNNYCISLELYIYYDDIYEITEEIFMTKVLDNLYDNGYGNLIKDLNFIKCMYMYSDNYDKIHFINNRNCIFYFNLDTLDSKYWNTFKIKYIKNKRNKKLMKFFIISGMFIFGYKKFIS